MLFSSVEFVLAFLPITVLLFAFAKRFAGIRFALGTLTIASLVFYGLWYPWNIPLLLGSIVVNWTLSRWMGTGNALAKPLLGVGVVGNVALLFWFKYAAFVSTIAVSAGVLSHPFADKVLPLGISFFTFVQIAYLVDRYKGLAPAATFWNYLLFVSFFPHLIAGPIVHHASMMPQLESLRPNPQTCALAMMIFAIGIAKKTVLADSLGTVADIGFDHQSVSHLGTVSAWEVVSCYTAQLYFDFSGYSDMAVGLALMFGVQFPWNFLSPYKSTSIAQFWRRWHITLSNFLRDYVYIPLGGSRVSGFRHSINLMLTMLVGGIWHGAGWNFMLWGALHGSALVVSQRYAAAKRVLPSFVGWALTTLIVVCGWVLFRTKSLGDAGTMYKSLFTRTPGSLQVSSSTSVTLLYLLTAVSIVLFMPNTRQISERFRPTLVWAIGGGLLMAVSMLFILGKRSAPEFLYYKF